MVSVLWRCPRALTTRVCRAVKWVSVGEAGTRGVCWGLRTQLTPGIRGRGEEAIEIRG